MANRRRTDTEGKYKKRVEEAETYKDIAGVLPGIGTAITVSDIDDELKKEDPSYLKVGILGASEAAGLIPGIGSTAKMLIRKGAQRLDDAADIANAEKLIDDAGALEEWREANKLPESQRQSNPKEAEEAAEKLFQGELTSKEARKRIGDAIPKPREFSAEEVMDMMPSVTEVTGAMGKKAKKYGIVGVKGFDLKAGDKVASRLDIPAYNEYDTWVVSIHDGTKSQGGVVGYGQAIKLKNIEFGSKAQDALNIARRKVIKEADPVKGTPEKRMGKSTIARVFGEYVPANPYDLQEEAAEIISSGSKEWTQVGMNPYRGSGFYVKETGEPVFEADEVIQVGALVLAKNIKKPTITQMKELGVKTADGKTRLFYEGGMALEDQMEMNFGETPNPIKGVDPVSGNEIPVGSTAEEVRDDIPANLSENEMVIAADVVKYWGVKTFEDMRDQAKRGYAQMEEEGRIGGQPMEEEDTMGLDISDLEIADMPEGDPEAEDAFLGKFFSDLRAAFSKPTATTSQPRDRSIEAIVQRAQANKGKPKNRAQAFLEAMQKRSDDDDRQKRTAPTVSRPTLTEKPATSDDSSNPSIAAQINFGGDYEDKPKKKTKAKVNKSTKATPFVDDGQETVNLRDNRSFKEKFLEGLGFDEGGMVEDSEPFYEQKGGFDMEDAMAETVSGSVMEARVYRNDAGHEIIIMFLNGEPITPIPEGYYPVGDAVTPPVDVTTDMGGGSSGGGGSGGAAGMQPTPINYKELSLQELTDMVNQQGSLKGDAIAAGMGMLHPIMGAAVKFALWNQTRQVKKEIERRLSSDETTNVDKMRYQNLLEIANRETPTILDKILGKDFEVTVGQIPKPTVPDVDYSDPTLAPDQGIAEPYTPEVTSEGTNTSSTLTEEQKIQLGEASAIAAEKAFGKPAYANPRLDPYAEDRTTPAVTQPEVRGDSREEKDAQRRRDRQEANKNISNTSTSRKTGVTKSATRGLGSSEKKGGAELDSRFGITGLKDGGIATKKGKKKKKSK